MDHFLSGLDTHNAPWYAARSSMHAAHAQAHEFAVGTSKFFFFHIFINYNE